MQQIKETKKDEKLKPCQGKDCKDMGSLCTIYDPEKGKVVKFYYCWNYASQNGFCPGCGEFWGGIESFEFNNPSGLCETCRSELEADTGDYDDYEDFDDGYY